MNREGVLQAALGCVCGDREQDYGSPEDNFQVIADMWTAYLRRVLGGTVPNLDTWDVAAMMALLKIARIAGGGTEDCWVDLAGYAACGGELHSGGGECTQK